MLHFDPTGNDFDERLALSQLDHVTSSRAMATTLAENYTGPRYDAGWSSA